MDELFSYLSGTRATRSDRSVNTEHYKPITNRLEQTAENEVVRESGGETLKEDWREDVQVSTKNKKGFRPVWNSSSNDTYRTDIYGVSTEPSNVWT